MMDWFYSDLHTLWVLVLKTVIFYLAIILYSRILGLRSFSKMSTFDFAMTVAIGSMLATVALNPEPAIVQSVVVLGTLFFLQFLISLYRLKQSTSTMVDNSPLLIMEGNEVIEENLHKAGMTRTDLFAKIRLAGVTDLSNVYAVIAETTGDISVMHGNPDEKPFDYNLLYGVRDIERLTKNGSFNIIHKDDGTQPNLE